jgi:hypothetical protein
MKRSRLTRRTPLKRGKRMRQRSTAKALRDDHYKRLRAEFLALEENEWCPVADSGLLHERVRQRATEVHHKRGRVGKFYLDVSTWLAVSREGHQWIERHRAAARDRGWHLSRK